MKNKCDNCLREIATCPAEKIVFGVDVNPETAYTKDADAVVECDCFQEKKND